MIKIKKFFTYIHYSICIGLLTLLLVTTVMPAVANIATAEGMAGKMSAPHTQTKQVQNPKLQLDEGRTLFEAGRFSLAASVWEQAATGFQRQGDAINQAWSLSYLSLAYQNLGDWEKAQSTITNSLNLLQSNQQKNGNVAILAVALNTEGTLKIAMGQSEAALISLQKAERAYAAAGDEAGKIGSQINQAQALQALGLYRRSQKLLASVNEKLQNQPDSLLKVNALHSLGVALQVVGDLQHSLDVLKQSLAISQRLGSANYNSEILFSLGNTLRDLQQTEAALNYYQQAEASSTNPQVQVEARLNQLSLYVEKSHGNKAIALLPQIKSQLDNLPPSRMSVYAEVNFARSVSKLTESGGDNRDEGDEGAGGAEGDKLTSSSSSSSSSPSTLLDTSAQVLARAVQQAKSLGDLRAESYALNNLGALYEKTQQIPEAFKLTQQALQIAQEISASDIAYQASWQLGRILKAKEDTQGAIAAYDSAVKTLKSLRSDLVAINRDVQFSFQESVEPVYRQLVDLLLQPPKNLGVGSGVGANGRSPVHGVGKTGEKLGQQPSQNNLKQAREVIEALQLAELDNFFREACLNIKSAQIDQIDKTAAVIYPIILGDRLEVILSVPGQPLSNYKTNVSQAEIQKSIKLMRESLNPVFSNKERLQLSQQLYDWLIRPAESRLASSGIKTLTFVLDGSMRNLPMAALYDGKHYLVEKYSIALSPGLQLTQSRSLKGDRLKVITAGLSEARQGFKALPAVKSEVTEIANEVSTKLLFNEKFTDSNLQKAIHTTPFSILHLATHGQFSSKSDDTFILTWNGRINVKELDELLKYRSESESNPVELMVLSACQTAKGDNRAILGLAGVAVRSGARSTLATLWAVQDESTAQFMVEFYKQLSQPKINKAEALRKTQLVFLQNSDFQHPFYWAPFVLVGNWL